MSQDTALIFKSKSVFLEGLAIIGLGFFIVSFLTVLDIRMHDFYVLPIIEECYPENQSEFCTGIRIKHGLTMNAQVAVGDIYWDQLLSNALFVGITLFLVRMLFAFMLRHLYNRKIRGSTIFMAMTWGLVGSGLFLFGILDTFYYLFQGEDVPVELAWLNMAGVFNETKQWTGDPTVVEFSDLILTNVVGIAIIGFFLFITMVLYGNYRLSPRGIA